MDNKKAFLSCDSNYINNDSCTEIEGTFVICPIEISEKDSSDYIGKKYKISGHIFCKDDSMDFIINHILAKQKIVRE